MLAPADHHQRNPGVPFDPAWVEGSFVNGPAVERRAAELMASRRLEGPWRSAWLLRAVECLDLTTLAGDDTPGRVARLCAQAKEPIAPELLQALGVRRPVRVAAVCVYHEMIPAVKAALAGTPGVAVAAVSAGFPAGLSPFAQRVAEIRASVDAGAAEIDVVITRAHVLTGEWERLYREVAAMREACGALHLKVILATGELGTLQNVARASLVAMMAGADFIKTSTGKEAVNATIPAGIAMARAIREYQARTGHKVGLKAAGGIRQADEALSWLIMVKEELGEAWLSPGLFRIGASGLLSDLERELRRAAEQQGLGGEA